MDHNVNLGIISEKFHQFDVHLNQNRYESLGILMLEIRELLLGLLGEVEYRGNLYARDLCDELIDSFHYLIGAIVGLEHDTTELTVEIMTRYRAIYRYILNGENLQQSRSSLLETMGIDIDDVSYSDLVLNAFFALRKLTTSSIEESTILQFANIFSLHGNIELIIRLLSARYHCSQNTSIVPLEDEDSLCVSETTVQIFFQKALDTLSELGEKLNMMLYEERTLSPEIIRCYQRCFQYVSNFQRVYDPRKEQGISEDELLEHLLNT